jgi:bifunctional DNase/RNase
MVEVVVSRLGMDASSQSYVVVLQEKRGPRLLPIWIGQAEAESIVMHMHDVKRDRPSTHDLCKSLIVGLGAALRRVQITHVANNTYHGDLQLERAGQFISVDVRPSDAIAIALRLDAPIFATETLLALPDDDEESGAEDSDDDNDDSSNESFLPPTALRDSAEPGAELSAEQLKEYLEQLRPEDFGKFKL